ncbi:uncharacterized protein LOC144761610 isoform X2 [Lissotriton helveticus]
MTSRKAKQPKETGDRHLAPFQKLEHASLELMHSTLNHPRHTNKEKAGVSQTVSEIAGLESQLKQQLIDMATNHGTRSREKENIDRSMNVSLDLMHPELENAVCAVKNKELSIYRMQCSDAIQNEIENNTQDSESILEVMKNSIAVYKKVHSVQSKNQLLEDQILDVRRRRIADRPQFKSTLGRRSKVKKSPSEHEGISLVLRNGNPDFAAFEFVLLRFLLQTALIIGMKSSSTHKNNFKMFCLHSLVIVLFFFLIVGNLTTVLSAFTIRSREIQTGSIKKLSNCLKYCIVK